MSQNESLSLAYEIVEREIAEKTGVLILANLGLSSLPSELFSPALGHVTELHLGNGWGYLQDGSSIDPPQDHAKNTFQRIPGSIRSLRNLRALKCQQVTHLCETGSLNLPNLEVLDLSKTGVESVGGLTCTKLRVLNLNQISLKSLEGLPPLPELETLTLTWSKISSLEGIQSCSRLETLLLSYTGVTVLDPISGHPHLRTLECASVPVRSLVPLPELRNLRCPDSGIVSLHNLEFSPNLEILDCFRTEITDLSPLDGMPLLRKLNCDGTKVRNLQGLNHLPALTELSMSQSEFASFAGAPPFPELRVIHCIDAKLKSFSGMPSMPRLHNLQLRDNEIRNFEGLPDLPGLTELNLGYSPLESLSGIEKLGRLQKFSAACTRISDLWPLSGLSNLKELDVSSALVRDLSALKDLTMLEVLSVWGNTHIDITSVSGLHQLKELSFRNTNVEDLSPLAGLTKLEKLDFGSTEVSDLTPISNCRHLREVNLGNTKVSDLSILTRFPRMEELNVSFNDLDSLEFIRGYTRLKTLNCSDTEITDLEPLRGKQDLMEIDFSDTLVEDIEPLVDLPTLMLINCSNTDVTDLRPFKRMQEVFSLTCEGCHFEDFSPDILDRMYQFDFSSEGGTIRGIPHEITQEDCINDLIAHCKDLEKGAVSNDEVKVLVLGNGLVGKTQICNHLRGLPFEQESDSTHGIAVATAELAGDPGLRLNLWDFGGQDLYYGTHSLFARGRSIFLLVWSPDSELSEDHVTHGIVHRNRELLWWLGYARVLGGPDAAVIVVQNKCDEKEQIWEVAPGDDGELEAFGFQRSIACSAKNGRGLDELTDTIRTAANWIQDRDGPSNIGTGRARARETLQKMREADLAKPPSERSHRLITIEQIETLCAEAGGVSSPEHLLRYLHSSGFLFYRKGLFGNKVVLDQSWALDAIYSIFQRETIYPALLAAEGRFTRPFLGGLAWEGNGNTPTYTAEEQRVFIGMMIECGICYINTRSGKVEHNDLGTYEWVPDDDAIFVAPDLLPELDPDDTYIKNYWIGNFFGRASEDQWSRSYWFPFLPPGYIQRILALFDRKYDGTTVLWNQGIAFACSSNHSFDFTAGPYFTHIRIEQIPDAEGSGGCIQIRARDLMGQHPLKEICEKIDSMIDSSGISGVEVEEIGEFY